MSLSNFSTYLHYYFLYSMLSKILGLLLPERHDWIKPTTRSDQAYHHAITTSILNETTACIPLQPKIIILIPTQQRL